MLDAERGEQGVLQAYVIVQGHAWEAGGAEALEFVAVSAIGVVEPRVDVGVLVSALTWVGVDVDGGDEDEFGDPGAVEGGFEALDAGAIGFGSLVRLPFHRGHAGADD